MRQCHGFDWTECSIDGICDVQPLREQGADVKWLMDSFNCDLSSVLRHDGPLWMSLREYRPSKQRSVAVGTLAKGALRQHFITSGLIVVPTSGTMFFRRREDMYTHLHIGGGRP